MNRYRYTTAGLIGALILAVTQPAWTEHSASTLETRIKEVFPEQELRIKDYDDQLKEVSLEANTYFTTHDGRYIFAGPVFDTLKQEDIAVKRGNERRKAQLDSLPKTLITTYSSVEPTRHELTVFTDIDCPYCRKMHDHMDAFNALGITVNYIMLPRAGIGSSSYQKTAAALCADDPASEITRAMQGAVPESRTCQHTLKEQVKLAQKLRIQSTPAVVMPDGSIKLGLIGPEEMQNLLKKY